MSLFVNLVAVVWVRSTKPEMSLFLAIRQKNPLARNSSTQDERSVSGSETKTGQPETKSASTTTNESSEAALPTAQPSPTVASEIPKGAKVITGSFANFQSGDYLHAGIRKANGEIVYFFLGKPSLEYFLVTHKEQKLDLFYETVNTYIPESGGKEKIRQLVGGKAGDLTYESRWKQIQTILRVLA